MTDETKQDATPEANLPTTETTVSNLPEATSPEKTIAGIFDDPRLFPGGEMNFYQRRELAKVFAAVGAIPERWRPLAKNAEGKMVPDWRPALVAMMYAESLEMNPVDFMGMASVINGRLRIEGKAVAVLIRRRSPFKDFEVSEAQGEGDARFVIASGTNCKTGTKKQLRFSIGDAKKAGWFNRSDSFWHKLPDQMLNYRATTLFCDAHCAEARMGIQTAEELVDVGGGVEVIKQRTSADLASDLKSSEPIKTRPALQLKAEVK